MSDLRDTYHQITTAIELAEHELPDDPEHSDAWFAAQVAAWRLWQLAESRECIVELLKNDERVPEDVWLRLEGMG